MDKIKNVKKLVLTGLLCTSMGVVAPLAEITTTSTLDPNETGSITLYKLVSEDGKHDVGTGTETDLSSVGQIPLAGVGFSYLKVGDLVQLTDAQVGADEDSLTGVYYTLTSEFVALLDSCGISVTSTTISGNEYYTSEAINAAFKSLNTAEVAYDDSKDGSTAGNEVMNAYVKDNGTAMALTDDAGKTVADNLELGLYVVCEVSSPNQLPDGVTQAVARPSRPFMIALPMTNITEIDGHAAGTVWQYDVTAYPKNEMINIRKDIIADGNDLADGTNNGLTTATDKNVGDYINFLLTFDVPKLQPEADGSENHNRKFVVTDTMTDGLTIDAVDKTNFKVTYGSFAWNNDANEELVFGDDYTVAYDKANCKFTLALTDLGLAKLDVISTDVQLFVNYSARLNEKAAENTGAIKEEGNVTKLVYGTSVSADREFDSNQDVKAYTYEIDINKTFTGTVADASAVSFSIQGLKDDGSSDFEDLSFIKEAEGIYHLFDGKETGTPVSEVNVAANGKLILKGLDARTYIVTEENTVGGYNLMRDPITVEFSKASLENGKIDTASVKSGNGAAIDVSTGLENGYVGFEIRNNETIDMLHTGGEGWNNMLTIAGMAAVTAGGAIFIFKRKKESEED